MDNKAKVMPPEINRINWTNQLDFFLSCLGFAVGLGNVWRFPYLCYTNGGGAFLIPYTCMLATCGLPLFFLEICLGQYHGKGPNILFKNLAPAFEGIGYAMIMVSFNIVLYYTMVLAWTLFYLFSSFTSHLKWHLCGNSWNTQNCFNLEQTLECEAKNMTYWSNTCVDMERFCTDHGATVVNKTFCRLKNETLLSSHNPPKRVTPSEEYFLNNMLGISSGFEEFGGIRWQLALCLLGSWVIVALCIIKGIKSSGKVVYFTALFPYFLLIILFIRGVTLEGSLEGIKFYIVPKWNEILSAKAWGDASSQIFYSLGPALGGLITLSSYNKFSNNCYRDAIFVSVINCGTSVFAGFTIFSIVGFMAHSLNQPVSKVVTQGAGLAFIAYPEAVTKMPLSSLWAILFFLMLITLALDSIFALCEAIITGIHDVWPKFRKKNPIIVIIICSSCFLLGLPLCTNGGLYLFTVMDNNAGGWTLLMICLFEVIVVCWIYGLDSFVENIEDMLGFKPNAYWTICWKYLSPLILIGVLLFTWINFAPPKLGSYKFPLWSIILGWLISFSSVMMIPIFGVFRMWKIHKRGESLLTGFVPTEKWGPSTHGLSSSDSELSINKKKVTKKDKRHEHEKSDTDS